MSAVKAAHWQTRGQMDDLLGTLTSAGVDEKLSKEKDTAQGQKWVGTPARQSSIF